MNKEERVALYKENSRVPVLRRRRLRHFSGGSTENMTVGTRRAAITMQQARKYKLPPMISKNSDPRCKKYVKKYRKAALELGVLRAAVLKDNIKKVIFKYMDVHKYLEAKMC